jgi:hypothetical protein
VSPAGPAGHYAARQPHQASSPEHTRMRLQTPRSPVPAPGPGQARLCIGDEVQVGWGTVCQALAPFVGVAVRADANGRRSRLPKAPHRPAAGSARFLPEAPSRTFASVLIIGADVRWV